MGMLNLWEQPWENDQTKGGLDYLHDSQKIVAIAGYQLICSGQRQLMELNMAPPSFGEAQNVV